MTHSGGNAARGARHKTAHASSGLAVGYRRRVLDQWLGHARAGAPGAPFSARFRRLRGAASGGRGCFRTRQNDEAEYWRQTALAVAAPGTVEPAALRAFLRAQSRPYDEALALLRELAESGRWQLGMLNNESRELNQYRIDYFGLNRYFTVCFSSCWMDARKPDALIYERALNLLQRRPEEIVFTDDREQNLVYPRMMGWHTIHFQNTPQLREELRRCGVDPARAA